MSIQIYRFSATQVDGKASMKDVLGGKGANLAEMASLGLPVPPGFTIPTSASVAYGAAQEQGTLGQQFTKNVKAVLEEGMAFLTEQMGYVPLVSVRSGARVSMPGMMDTILNVGLTSETLPVWKEKLGERAALDSYRRLIQMYGSVAMGVPMTEFEGSLEACKEVAGVKTDSELGAKQLEALVESFKKIVKVWTNLDFPDTMADQLLGATFAVFKSWDNPRAQEYRKINDIPYAWGTAVNVQSMVFGNLNDQSATGVLFSRNPSTGEAKITGEFLVNAQGEDVVAGIRTPEPLTKLADWDGQVAEELSEYVEKLEDHYRDMQDIEFTVQDGKLYILQTRNGKRSAQAAFRIAYDMAEGGLITQKEAFGRVSAAQLFAVMQDRIDPSFKTAPDATGIAAGGGIVSGIAVFSSENAVNCKEPCILVTQETDPDDIAGMNAARGILTATGGLTSHAAVVARGMNKTCVVGCTALDVSSAGNIAKIEGGKSFHPGAKVTIDGATGSIWVGIDVPLIAGGASAEVIELLSWGNEGEIAERVELSPAMNAKEDFKKLLDGIASKSIYLDIAKLEAGDRFAKSKSHIIRLTSLGLALSEQEFETIVVDLSPRTSHYMPGDGAFDFMFGVSSNDEAAMQSQKAEAVSIWFETVKDKVVVKGVEGNAKLILKHKGFKVLGSIETFADLLDASGPLEVTPEVITKVFGTAAAYQAAVEMIGKLGKKSDAKPLPVPKYWYESLISKEA